MGVAGVAVIVSVPVSTARTAATTSRPSALQPVGPVPSLFVPLRDRSVITWPRRIGIVTGVFAQASTNAVGSVWHAALQPSPPTMFPSSHVSGESSIPLPHGDIITHPAPTRMKPGLQVKPQLVPSHVRVPFATGAQAVQRVPQLATLSLATQVAPQRC